MHLPVDDAAFEVKLALPCLHMLEEVAHEEDMDLCLILHMHSEDAIDSGNQTVLVLDEVGEIAWQALQHDLLLTPVHGLDDEALVVGLEHEAA